MSNIRIYISALSGQSSLRLLLLSLITCISLSAYGEDADSLRPPSRRESLRDTLLTHNKTDLLDVVKIIIGIKNKHIQTKKAGDAGTFYNVYPYPGYTQATGWIGAATFNVNFRPSRNTQGFQSYLNNYVEYTQFNQTIAVSISTFYTNDNKWQFPGDLRYFNFPTTTYGIGSSAPVSAAENIDFSHFRFYRQALHRLGQYGYLGGGYNLDYRWNIYDQGVSKGVVDDFVRYGYSRKSVSTGPSANFLFDSRDNVNQPIQGLYVNLQFNAHIKALGSNSNWNSMLLDIRKFIPLSKKWYTELAIWGYVWLTLDGHPPYLDMPSIGWDPYNNTGRQFPIGRFAGLNMLDLETEFRFDIMRNGLVGGIVFGNVSTFTELNGHYFGPLQPGYGAGIRVKFNKNTASNGCLDYGRGTHNQGGFSGNINEFF